MCLHLLDNDGEVWLSFWLRLVYMILVSPRAHARLDTDMSKHCVVFKLGRHGGPLDGSCPHMSSRIGVASASTRRQSCSSCSAHCACRAILRIVFTHDGFSSISDSIALLNDSTHGYRSSPHTLARFELKTNVY